MSEIVITVRGTDRRGFVRPLTFTEEVTEARRATGSVVDALLWPVPAAEYGKDEAAAKRRRRNYGDAVGQAQGLARHVAWRIAKAPKNKPVTLHIVVESGACMSSESDANGQRIRWGNVVAPEILRSMAEFPGTELTVHAGADNPLDYVPEETEEA